MAEALVEFDAVSREDIHLLSQGDLPLDWQWVPASENACVATRLDARPVYFKMFYNRNKLERFKSIVRGSRCRRAVEGSTLLERHGFRVPPIVQVGRVQEGRNRGLEYFVSEAVAAVGLADYVYENWRRPLCAEQLVLKRNTLVDLGRLIGRMHRKNIVHGDLRPNNVLVSDDGASLGFYFIDNERNSVSQSMPEKKRIKNLIQIGMIFPSVLSRTDRLRFFKSYCSAGGLRPSIVRGLAGEVFRLTNKRLAGRDAF